MDAPGPSAVPPPAPTPHAGPLPIVARGRRWVVIDKPAGLLSVPGKGPLKADCAAARVRAMFPDAAGPLVVHRLDMDTSGLLLFALDADAQRDLSAQFERRSVRKRYTALVEGQPLRDEGVLDAPIRLDPERRPFQIHDPVHGQPALTRYRVVARETDRARVEFEPLTGRTHQLRVHAALAPPAGLGAAIVGDVLYGAGGRAVYEALRDGREPPAQPPPAERLMLHAAALEFADPDTGGPVACASAAPF